MARRSPTRGQQNKACSSRRHPTYCHPLKRAMADLLGKLLERCRQGKYWTPLLLSFNALLMALDPSPTLAERFEQAGLSLALLLPRRRRGHTYQGFIKALQHRPDLHRQVALRLRQAQQQIAGPHARREGHLAFAVDSSKINCPRTSANQAAFGCGGKPNGPPQQLLTVLWDMGLGLPWSYESGPGVGSSEREHLLRMLPLLPEAALLVADAGFVGYDLLRQIVRSRRHFLIRVGRHVHLLQKLGWAVQEQGQTVYLWPAQSHRGGDRKGQRHRQSRPPLGLRLIRLPVPGKADVCLLTDLREEGRLSQPQASVLYRMRWGVEVFYRGLKRKLGHHKLCSAAPRRARQELAWAVLAMWIVGLLSVKAVLAAGHDPLNWSLAAAVRAVRRALHQKAAGQLPLEKVLAQALRDSYRRRGPKAARPWPRKRSHRPPGEPIVRDATAEEIALAKAFHGEEEAA